MTLSTDVILLIMMGGDDIIVWVYWFQQHQCLFHYTIGNIISGTAS